VPYRQNFPIPAVIDPPKTCLQIEIPDHPEWKAVISGLLFELTYWFNWERTGDTSGAQCAAVWKQVYNSIDWSDMSCCCQDIALIYRVNPTTGNIEQSNNGGSTWSAAAGGLQSVIVNPVPPVTSGVAGTKCDAATNLAGQVDVWIDQVSNDFTTAESLVAFATAVFEAILIAVLVAVSAGTLTGVAALVIPTLGAALGAAWGAGKAVFDAYWTTDIKDAILCAAFCTIGEDGSFTDGQFTQFWNQINGDLPPSPAKMLFMGFLSSVGKQGLNAMAASGMAADADCEDCSCGEECLPDSWNLGAWNGSTYVAPPTLLGAGDDYLELGSVDRGDGQQYVYITSSGDNDCCDFTVEGLTGTLGSNVIIPCGTSRDNANFVPQGLTPLENINALGVGGITAFTVKITFAPV